MNIWNISVETGHVVMLGFEQLDTYCYSYSEIPYNCECVRLEVYDGRKRIYQKCGFGAEVGLLVSSGSTMDIVLAGKQARANMKYFTAVYKSILAENVNRSCGWNSTNQEGVIVSPGFPNNYSNLLICEWTIKVASSTGRIQLEIQEYDIDQSYSCNFDSLEVYGGYDSPSNLQRRYCGKLNAADYVHLTLSYPILLLRFVSNWNVTGPGFQAKWKADRTYIHFIKPKVHIFYPSYCNHGECIWNITVPERNAIQLDITEYKMYCDGKHMYNPCDCSVLEVYDGPYISNGSLIKRHCHTENQPHMSSSSNNMIIVLKNYQDQLSGSLRADYKTVNSSTVCSNFPSNGIFRSPHYPNAYPNYIDCSYTINLYNPGYQIVFNVTDIHLQEPEISSSSCKDYVEIGYSRTHRFCGNTLPYVVITNESTTVRFHSDGAITNSGFQLQYGFREFDCGNSMLTGQQGSITSPGYPKAFHNMINCSWTILVDSGHVVNFAIDYINMEGSGAEEGDSCVQSRPAFLQIFEETLGGNRSTNGSYVFREKYCGYAVPVPFISTTNNLTVEFISWDNYNRYTGFSASFTALETSSVFRSCGGVLIGNSGTITSPNYPQDYPNNTVCIWSIMGTTGYPIRISFSDFFLGDSNSCQKDLLELRNGPDSHSSRLNILCGNNHPTDITSSGDRMYLKFYSDSRSTFRGFNATWTSVCEQTLTSDSGTFRFPTNTDVHPGKVQCTYVIRPYYYQSLIVRLTFSDFYLNNDSSNCEHTYIEVRDGGFENSPLLGSRYCGNTTPPVLTSTQSSVWIRFVTDGSQSSRFTIHYDRPSVCGQTALTGSEGRFTTPFYPNNYPLALTCTWTITPGPNSTVQLIFRDFLLEGPSCYCPYDWVQLSEGSDHINLNPSSCPPETSTPGKFCSNLFERDIKTKHPGYPLILEFKSDSSRTNPGFSASYVIYDPEKDYLSQQYDLYPFGLEHGDTLLKPLDAQVEEVFISTGFPVASTIQNKVYVANKGLVTFKERDTGKDFKLKEDKMMICPYNSDIGANITTGGVYYQLHENNRSVLDKASAEVREFKSIDDYNASIVLLVTWDRVAHVKSSYPAREQATVQLALISNGIQSFALVYYRTGAMNWAHLQGEPLAIGVANGNPNEVIHSIYDGSNAAFTLMDTIPGNAGKNSSRKGMWIYDVGHSYSADQVCQNWFNRNQPFDISRQEGFKHLPQCPCNKQFLRGTWLWSHNQDDYRVECYRLNYGTSRIVEPYGQECCYTQSGGQYVADGQHAGRATAYNPEIQNPEYLVEDREAHDLCCYNTTTYEYCQMFYSLRPVSECTTRFPFGISFSWGDLHIKMLDGNEYTFNGWGEYTMVTLETSTVNFTLQGRTGLAETENGTLVNATVFRAFGAEENGVRVFVDLDPNTNNTMIIYANDVDYTLRFYKEGNSFLEDKERFMLRRENDSIYISFISGIDITVTVSFKSLEIVIALPMTFQNQTQGLLGNFNGIKDDDFVLPNGTTLRSSLTDRQIFYGFGNEWTVTEKNSVMRYGIKEGPANYSHPEFTPIFLDEQPNDTRKAAEDLCGVANLACVYDYIATKSVAIANATKQTAERVEITVKTRKNTVPTLSLNTTIRINSGETMSFILIGTDPDPGDNLTYFMVDNTENYAVQLDTYTGQVTLNVNLSQLVSLSFYAVDSANMYSPISEIYMIICSRCSGHGTCDFDRAISDVKTNVQIATCICNPGWSGPDCSEDYNACAESPCSTYQNCTDLTPDEQGNSTVGFKCSNCSQGYQNDVTDRTRCWDVDECSTNSTNKCSVKCWNTPGSYTCGCNYGYRLNRDGISCDDINECAEHLDICEQTCVNNVGSYSCSCYEGYSLSGVQGHCEKDAAFNSGRCQTEGCSEGCSMQASTNGSLVPTCFCKTGYEIDTNNTKLCVDKDECKDEICSQACRNTIGSFACMCYPGNKLSSDQRTCIPCDKLRYGNDCLMTCECSGRGVECNPISGCVCQTGWTGEHCETDVDECEKTETPCPIGQICTNTDGSFTCSCPTGYLKQSDGTCVDVDECSDTSILNTCTRLEVCVNSPGAFSCECKMGYTHTMPDSNCTDIDECATSDVACEQQCTNVLGTYNCHCHFGYRLNADRTSCSKVADVCAEFEGLHCEHGCTINDNEHGVCICNTGYQLAANQQNCTDINECTGKNNCSHNCTNTAGGFYCSCPIGTKLDNSKLNCIDCSPGTYGLNCSQVCACGVGASGCDAKMGCICKAGWTGDKCDHDIDECNDPLVLLECHNKSAECNNFQGGYHCRCWKGYEQSGNNTCQDIDECRSNPCHHICENSLGSYRCLCQTGFTLNASSNICEDLNECELSGTHACQQQCDNIVGSYRCSCNKVGFVLENDGVSCKATSNCSIMTCPTENGGCSQERCFCNSGYELNTTSNMCVVPDIDWCANSTCEQTCTETEDGRSFLCGCTDGYLLNSDRRHCRECTPGSYGKNCRENCTCTTANMVSCNTVNGTCTCKPGWTGVNCESEIDECKELCIPPALCTNIPGSYVCSCGNGYTKIQGTCQDINECEGTHNCKKYCNNTEGSYNCFCDEGYVLSGDNVTCVDINECEGKKVCDQQCNNTDGSYICFCDSGYALRTDNVTCVDINECNGTHNCKKYCNNTEGSYYCFCDEGYVLSTDNVTCVDINECEGRKVCDQQCNNTDGSYICFCDSGYSLSTDNVTCVDINECEGTHNCTKYCNNTEGSYNCFCEAGYVLSTDNVTCVDINECEGTNVCNQHCNNTDGSYICFCNSGYALSTDNVTCVDINECEGTHNCTKYCNNTEGSYNCFCDEGYVLSKDNVTCVDSNECLGAHRCTPLCVKLEAGYHCSCNSGYTLSSDNVTCEDVNECESSHGCHTCFNRPGSFSCLCKEGFRLNADNKSCDEISRINFELKLDITEKVDLSNEDTYNALRLHCQVQLSEFLLPRASGVLEVEIISIRVGSLIFEAAAVVLKELQQESALGLVVALTELSRTNVTIGNFTGRASVTLFPPGGRLPVLINGNTNPCKVATETSICVDDQECIELDERTIFCRHIESKDSSWFLVVVLSTAIPAAIIVLSLAIFVCVYCKNKKDRKNEADNMFSSTRARDEMEMRTNMKIHASISQNSQYSISRPRVSSRGNALMN